MYIIYTHNDQLDHVFPFLKLLTGIGQIEDVDETDEQSDDGVDGVDAGQDVDLRATDDDVVADGGGQRGREGHNAQALHESQKNKHDKIFYAY